MGGTLQVAFLSCQFLNETYRVDLYLYLFIYIYLYWGPRISIPYFTTPRDVAPIVNILFNTES